MVKITQNKYYPDLIFQAISTLTGSNRFLIQNCWPDIPKLSVLADQFVIHHNFLITKFNHNILSIYMFVLFCSYFFFERGVGSFFFCYNYLIPISFVFFPLQSIFFILNNYDIISSLSIWFYSDFQFLYIDYSSIRSSLSIVIIFTNICNM